MSTKTYSDSDRGVAALKQQESPLDSEANGVKVAFAKGRFEVSFPFSLALMKPVKKIPGSAFDKEAKVWAAPGAEYDAVKATVESMRDLSQSMASARSEVEAAAKNAIPNAIVRGAMTKEGTRSSGPILAINEHYVAQSNGKNYVDIHERAALGTTKDIKAEDLKVGQDVSVFYSKGTGLLWNRIQNKDRDQAPAQAPAAEQPSKPAKATKAKKQTAEQAGPAR